jgi:uncharacterized membrane protein YbhN (UPF0104 family)
MSTTNEGSGRSGPSSTERKRLSRPRAQNALERPVKDASPAPLWRPLSRRLLKLVLDRGACRRLRWLPPQFIDYEQVWDALTQLDAWELLVLLGLGLARVPTEALMYRAFLPGLSLWRGSEAYLSSNFAGQLLPPPGASVVQYGYFRGGGHTADASTLAALGSFIFPTIGRFLLPLVALVLLFLTGEVNGSVVLAGTLALVVTAVAGSPATSSCAERGRRAGSERRRNGRSPGFW